LREITQAAPEETRLFPTVRQRSRPMAGLVAQADLPSLLPTLPSAEAVPPFLPTATSIPPGNRAALGGSPPRSQAPPPAQAPADAVFSARAVRHAGRRAPGAPELGKAREVRADFR